MIEFNGTYFDGITSKAHQVRIQILKNTLLLQTEGQFQLNFSLKNCSISPPLGKTTRSIKLPGGALCETDDIQAIAQLEKMLGTNRGLRLVNFLESQWKLVGTCFIGLVFFILAFITYGIPYLAAKAAFAVSSETNEMISEKTLKVLYDRYLKASKLKQERILELKQLFEDLLPKTEPTDHYHLEFRQSSLIGPNAFALPSGIILMTDELVELSEDDRELAGILMHEITHVKERHGLRSIFQNAGVFLLVSILVGDIASITSTAATLPTLLAQSNYSRKFEKEADNVAGLYCIRQGWTTSPLRNILKRIDKERLNFPGASLISNHPLTAQRLKFLEDLDKEYQ